MFEKMFKRQMDKTFSRLNVDDDPELSQRFKRFLRWMGYKFFPFIFMIAQFLVLYWILNRVNTNYGWEKMLALGLVIIIFNLQSLKPVDDDDKPK